MQNWNYIPQKLVSLTLAADARLCQTDYINDQIWNMRFGSADPPSISLETTFGLRARMCRIFPRFICEEKIINNPDNFFQPISIHKYFPNYIELSFKPFSHINVKIEVWVPSSHAVAGRVKIKNIGQKDCEIDIDWANLLLPAPDGERMTLKEIDLATILVGKSSNIFPVFILEGGTVAGKSPYPSLSLPLYIAAREEKVTRWAQACLPETSASYSLAKEVNQLNWHSEIAKIKRINSKPIEIFTGNKDWDTAFGLAKNIAYQLFLHPIQKDKNPSFVLTRNHDQGFSLLEDGSDYNHLWNGQSAIDAQYIMNFILPESPDLLKGILDTFLDSQNSLGEIDLRPGLGGQLSRIQSTPLLADMALNYYEITADTQYIQSIFPKLISHYNSWFLHSHDRDDDRIPEWDQLIQTGYEDHPLFSINHPWSDGADISTVEAPDLVAYLFHECSILLYLAEILGEKGEVDQLRNDLIILQGMIYHTWNDHDACYHRRDRDSHSIASEESLGSCSGVGVIDIQNEFQEPIRPIFKLTSQGESTKTCQVYIFGIGNSGSHRIENIPANRFRWIHEHGYATSEYCYKQIERIEINGVHPEDLLTVKSLNYNILDLSLALPLWAGMPNHQKAKVLINLSIMNKKKFLSPYGLRSFLFNNGSNKDPQIYDNMHFPWIALILDGLAQYGERKKAADVFQRMMKAVINSLNMDMTFRHLYNCESGLPSGTQNTLTSLIPVGLFLKILGIKIYNPNKVELEGNNPFPWPVTLKYQGLTIIKHERKTLVIFPDGQNVTVNNDQKHMVQRKNQS